MNIILFLSQLSQTLVSWPLFIFVAAVAVLCTIAFKFIQFRYFMYAWKQVIFPPKVDTTQSTGDMTPIQAFVNTLSANLGNGTLAGVAAGIATGGPGAIIWLVLFGILLMSVRFAEAFLSMHYGALAPAGSKLGGPMLYLREAFAGPTLAAIYGGLCFIFCLIGGNSVQTNSIALSFQKTFNIAPLVSAVLLTVLILYIVGGGAARIVKISVAIVPVKIVVFFGTTLIVLAYHYKALAPAVMLMVKSAFAPSAAVGGLVGFTVTQAIAAGMMRQIFATESGLGTAGIMFGSSGSKAPINDAIVAMLSTFISTVFCFIVGLCIVASGVWNSGFTSTALTIEAFNTVFGSLGGYAVTFLSITFGVGVLIAYAYITREVWLSLTKGRYAFVFPILYCAFAFGGALIDPAFLWASGDIPMAFMLMLNLYGIVYLLPIIRRNVIAFMQSTK